MRIRPLCHLSGSYDQGAEYSFTTDERKPRQRLVSRAENDHWAKKWQNRNSWYAVVFKSDSVRGITELEHDLAEDAHLVSGLAAVGISGRASHWGCSGDRCWPRRCSGIWPGHFFFERESQFPTTRPLPDHRRCLSTLACPVQNCRRRLSVPSGRSTPEVTRLFSSVPAAELRSSCRGALRTTRSPGCHRRVRRWMGSQGHRLPRLTRWPSLLTRCGHCRH